MDNPYVITFLQYLKGKKAIVVSPTISLMEDQVENLQRKGIPAIFLGSAQLDTSAESIARHVKVNVYSCLGWSAY